MSETAHPILRLGAKERREILLHGLAVFASCFALTAAAAGHVLSRGGSYQPSPAAEVPYFLALFMLATALILLLIRTRGGGWLLEATFSVAMLFGAWLVADVFLPSPWSLVAGSLLLAARFTFRNAAVSNLALVAGISGISGSIAVGLSPNALVIVLTMLAFYDIVAVYATKHMVRMFRGLVARGVVLAFVLTRLKREDLLAPSDRPSAAMLLGTGDVALPAMLVASSLRYGAAPAIGSALGAMAGFVLMFSLFLGQERRRPMPALPPIALGAILGHFTGLLL